MKGPGGLGRSGPLRRATPLSRGLPPLRRTPMSRPAARHSTRTTDTPTSVKRTVATRDQDRCVRCGETTIGRSRSTHHRRPRRMGGTAGAHTPENLILLCGTGTFGCHGWVESNRTESIEMGWLVRSETDPATVPVMVAWLGRCWPGTDWTPVVETT